MKYKFGFRLIAISLVFSILGAFTVFADKTEISASAAEASEIAQLEYLDRGTVAVKSGSGVYLSWRLLGTENYDTAFDIYRDNEKIATVSDSTNYTDSTVGSSYTVVQSGDSASSGKAVTVNDNQYITIPLDVPESGTSLDDDSTYTYSPNDVTPADVDGDGEYELILKWEPSNSFDSGKDAKHNGNVYIDCYKLNGTKLWRIDMGININAGQHFTQLAAYDFDLDGKAELAMKTAPGTKDGQGEYVSAASSITEIQQTDNTADYRHGKNNSDTGGRVLSGDEYYTVFQGDTGAALDTIYYPHPRGTISEWGDAWGNRSERYLAAVAYLDGQTPSMIAWRGYYAKTTATAYNLVNKKLVQIADFDTSNGEYSQYAGNGNHNLTVGDVDSDGKDEILCGSLALDDDFSVLWCSGRGHGDALHLADYDPTHEGMEYFSVHEDYSGSLISGSTTGIDGQKHLGGMTLYDAATGEELFHVDSGNDTGRGMIANVGYTDGYFELWGEGNYASYGGNNISKVKYYPDSTNQRIFWNGDTYDELLDGTGSNDDGSSVKISGASGRVQTFSNIKTINGTKNNVCLIADLFGDWREEIVARGSDNSNLLIYTTTIPTEHKLYTLMHDRAYRMQVASQNAGYNQPPHIGYYINDENDKNDMRKTAAYVKTVHDGKAAVRTANLPAATFNFKMKVQDNALTITNNSKENTDALIYIAKYDGGVLSDIKRQEITIPSDGYSGEINADVGDAVFLWDKNQKPLAKKLIIEPASTPTPSPSTSPSASPSPTPSISTTPTPTPTATPIPDFVVKDGVLTKYNGTDTDVVVPESVDGQTITSVSRSAFVANDEIEKVTLPDTVTEIKIQAFENCGSLKEIKLPSSLKEIPIGMFDGCSSLAKVDMPSALEVIGANAFRECTSLKEIELPNGLKEIDYNAFKNCISLESIEIPNSVELMDSSVFYECTSLRSVTLPSELEEIPDEAFLSCSALESITLPESVTKINDMAFEQCTSLSSVNLENVTNICSAAFNSCTSLTEISLGTEKTTLGRYSFGGCIGLVKFTVKNSETSLNSSGLDRLDNLSIYGYQESEAQQFADINDIPFYDLETGERVIREFVVDSDGVLLKYNGEEKNVVVPSEVGGVTVQEISDTVFCESDVTSVELPSSVTSVWWDAFADCLSLQNVKLSTGMTNLVDVFSGCTALEKVYIPSNITTINANIFKDCPNVTIYGEAGSAAETYANENNIAFETAE